MPSFTSANLTLPICLIILGSVNFTLGLTCYYYRGFGYFTH